MRPSVLKNGPLMGTLNFRNFLHDPYDIHTREIYLYTYIGTPQIKLLDPWVCTILHDPWFARQIKISRPLGLHFDQYVSLARPLGLHYYLARPLGLHFNHYVSFARPFGMHYYLARPLGLHYDQHLSPPVRP